MLTVCHNEHCGTRRGLLPSNRPGLTGPDPVPGELWFTAKVVEPGPDEFDVTIRPLVLGAALREGDRYSILLKHGSAILAADDQVAAYEAAYLNGPECDPHPCRKATVELR